MSTEDSGTPRTVIYARVAKEQDSPETSEAQRAAVEAYAKAHGYEVAGTYAANAEGVVTEYGQQMSGGGFHVRNPEIQEFYPLAEWITHNQRTGGHVYRRRIIVVEDWTEITWEG